jgi:hypothetical protein
MFETMIILFYLADCEKFQQYICAVKNLKYQKIKKKITNKST